VLDGLMPCTSTGCRCCSSRARVFSIVRLPPMLFMVALKSESKRRNRIERERPAYFLSTATCSIVVGALILAYSFKQFDYTVQLSIQLICEPPKTYE
jgi:hypothetical protein